MVGTRVRIVGKVQGKSLFSNDPACDQNSSSHGTCVLFPRSLSATAKACPHGQSLGQALYVGVLRHSFRRVSRNYAPFHMLRGNLHFYVKNTRTMSPRIDPRISRIPRDVSICMHTPSTRECSLALRRYVDLRLQYVVSYVTQEEQH